MTARERAGRRIPATALLLALAALGIFPGAGLGAEPSPQAPPVPSASGDLEAVAPRPTRVSGRIFLKDGVTPAVGARVKLTSRLDGTIHETNVGRRGGYRLAVPPGIYALSVRRRLDLFESPTPLRVAPRAPAAIDLLLVRDVEPVVPGGPGIERRGPDPRPSSPVVVGTVVDVARGPTRRRGLRWAEALTFLGGLLAVAAAAD